jgi:Fe-S cluster assembly protein SufD
LEEPIHVVHLADAEGGSFAYRHLIAAAAGAAVTIIEEYVGSAGVRYLTNVVTEAFVADGAKVDHYKIQRESAAAYHFQTLESELGRDALFSNHAVTVGGRLGRNDIRGRLLGEESEAICNGLYLLQEDQLFDTHLFMDHAVPKCQSHELYKGILSGQARAVFCGRILVQQDAQETDAIQSNGNLLLSRAAKVNTMPQLEIYADDVKCTHGATIGELDEQALFYLQTRGVDSKQAHAMLTFAFANEVLDEVTCSVVKHRIESMVQAWLVGVNE